MNLWQGKKIKLRGACEDVYRLYEDMRLDTDAQKLYENDNFYSTRETAENTVRADNVLRRLRHYAIQPSRN